MVSSRKKQYDSMEWHIGDFKSDNNNNKKNIFLSWVVDMVVNFSVIHHTLCAWYNYFFVYILFLIKN